MLIKLDEVSVTYPNGVRAVSNISLELQGGVIGLLGPNGAGKSTLMRILVSLLRPSKGTVTYDGTVLNTKTSTSYKNKIGYMPQELGFHPSLTIRETLDYYGVLQKLKKRERQERISELLESTNLSNHAEKKIKQLSGGMKRRVGLAQAMLGNPDFLIVDEPTAGLDPEERMRIRMLLSSFSENRIILLSTHIVEDIANICRQVIILEKGMLTFQGDVKSLVDNSRGHVYTKEVANNQELLEIQSQYMVTNSIYTEKGISVRIVNTTAVPGAAEEDPNLEDAYFYARSNPAERMA